jgi:hypothetical protein
MTSSLTNWFDRTATVFANAIAVAILPVAAIALMAHAF